MKLSNENDNNINNDIEKGVLLETKPKTKKPSMYNVLLLNDDYTPMEFVVLVLRFGAFLQDPGVWEAGMQSDAGHSCSSSFSISTSWPSDGFATMGGAATGAAESGAPMAAAATGAGCFLQLLSWDASAVPRWLRKGHPWSA